MHRRLLALTASVVLLPLAGLSGQEQRPHQTGYLGAEVGVNISDLRIETSDEELESETETGFRAGAVFRWNFSELLGLQTGAAYAEKGATIRTGLVFAPEDVFVSLDYLEIPLLLNLSVPGSRSIGVRIYGGGSANFELNCESSVTQVGGEVRESCATPPAELGGLGLETTSPSLNLLFGAGLDLKTGFGVLTVDARYDRGLTDIVDTAPSLLKIKNESFQTTLGYQIPLPPGPSPK